jgi:protein ImuB
MRHEPERVRMTHPRKRAERWIQSDLLDPVSAAVAAPKPQAVPTAPEGPPREFAAELWCALHLPALCLEAVRDPACTAATPCSVLEPLAGAPRLVAVDNAAAERGVQPGMSLAAALAACPDLRTLPRDPRRERRRLQALAEATLAFTPRVSLEPPDELLLELRGSLRLFGGLDALLARVHEAGGRLGLSLRSSVAPTPRAALAGARAAADLRVTHVAQLVGRLAPLPVAVLRWPEKTLARLGAMGVRTLGELLRLPRAGFAQRFGSEALRTLDRLVGRECEPRRPFVPAARFRGRCDPLHELSNHAALLRHLEPLLGDLESCLRRRQCTISALRLQLRHRPPQAPTRLELRLAAPEFEAARFAALLAEHLARRVLPAPVRRIELRSDELLPIAMQATARPGSMAHASGGLSGSGASGSGSLWRPGEQGGAVSRETPALLERLRARLGHDAVYGLCLIADHRPEASWRVAEPALSASPAPSVLQASAEGPHAAREGAGGATRLRRPLWLLHRPQRLGALPGSWRLLDGPERIETGWWDGHDVARDYYLVRDARGAELWIFRERHPPYDWHLHGVFG